MSDTKQQYEELVASGKWSKETQLAHIVEYMDTYNLSAHFLSFLKLKEPEVVQSSADFSMEALMVKLAQSEGISEAIRMMSLVSRVSNPWTEAMVAETVERYISIRLEAGNELLTRELKIYFNMKHENYLKLIPVEDEPETKSSGKYRFGARGG